MVPLKLFIPFLSIINQHNVGEQNYDTRIELCTPSLSRFYGVGRQWEPHRNSYWTSKTTVYCEAISQKHVCLCCRTYYIYKPSFIFIVNNHQCERIEQGKQCRLATHKMSSLLYLRLGILIKWFIYICLLSQGIVQMSHFPRTNIAKG